MDVATIGTGKPARVHVQHIAGVLTPHVSISPLSQIPKRLSVCRLDLLLYGTHNFPATNAQMQADVSAIKRLCSSCFDSRATCIYSFHNFNIRLKHSITQ